MSIRARGSCRIPSKNWKPLKINERINQITLNPKNSNPHMKTIRIPIALAGVLVLMSCGGKNQQQAAPPPPSLQVATLEKQDITVDNTYSTTMEGVQNVQIWPKVGGFIDNIYVEEGQKVKKGQLLFKLETQSLSQDAKAAQAAVNVAQVEVDKLVPLVEKGIISEIQLATAKARLEQAKSSHQSIAANIGYSVIHSPVSGCIGGIPFKEGALVSNTMGQPLTVVSDISSIRAYFSMNEKELLEMKARMSLSEGDGERAAQEVELIMVNGKTYPHKGKIAMINNIINPTTGNVTLRADFPNPDFLLSSGSTGKVRIPTTYTDVWVIPQAATIDRQGNKIIFVLDGQTATPRPIDIIAQTQTEFIVTRSEEHTSELQSRENLVCRLLLEKKNITI